VFAEFLNMQITGAINGTAVFSQRIILDVDANGLFAAEL